MWRMHASKPNASSVIIKEKYVDTELIAATRVFSFSIAEQHTCINLHIKRLDGRMCCVREYLK
jgi:hypothetical protein